MISLIFPGFFGFLRIGNRLDADDAVALFDAHSPTTTHHSRPQSKNTQKRRSHHVLYEMRKQDPG